jgi:hypothetical protein
MGKIAELLIYRGLELEGVDVALGRRTVKQIIEQDDGTYEVVVREPEVPLPTGTAAASGSPTAVDQPVPYPAVFRSGKVTKPSSECPLGLPPGTFCRICGKTHR